MFKQLVYMARPGLIVNLGNFACAMLHGRRTPAGGGLRPHRKRLGQRHKKSNKERAMTAMPPIRP